MARHKLYSVSDFARRGYNLRIRCLGCERVIDASAVEMLQELHRRRARQIEAMEHRMRCQACGHRGAHISPVESEF
jgi:hypothetical protein